MSIDEQYNCAQKYIGKRCKVMLLDGTTFAILQGVRKSELANVVYGDFEFEDKKSDSRNTFTVNMSCVHVNTHDDVFEYLW